MREQLHRFAHHIWTRITIFHVVLYPLSLCFFIIVLVRKSLLTRIQTKLQAPIIIVGNVTVGGNGKTTFVIALVQHLTRAGYNVGVVSRGYRRQNKHSTILVDHAMSASNIGDEARLIWNKTQTLICVSPDRIKASRRLINAGCNIIVSDDGMQNYQLYRDIEVSLIASSAGFGNGLLLPAGPLREYPQRSNHSDFCVYQEQSMLNAENRIIMTYQIDAIINLLDQSSYAPHSWPFSRDVLATCAIGNPAGFFKLLTDSGFSIKTATLPDHDTIDPADFPANSLLFITEKDAVKIDRSTLKHPNVWIVTISPIFNLPIFDAIEHKLKSYLSQ